MSLENIKSQIIKALTHPEAEEGLYLDNFYNLHEEDERPIVTASQFQTLEALKELISEGKVKTNEDSNESVIFKLA